MQYEICFLNRRGRLSCLMTGQFSDCNHAARFARHAMDTAAARGKLHSAEIHGDGQRMVVMAGSQVQPKRAQTRRTIARPRWQVAAPA
jgi:hypothetical protein